MLRFYVSNQTLKRIDNERVATGSESYPEIQVTFSGRWVRGVRRALFIAETGEAYSKRLDANGITTVPPEVLKGKSFKISLNTTTDSFRITTNQLTIETDWSGYTNDTAPGSEFTPTEAELLWNAVEENTRKISEEETARKNADGTKLEKTGDAKDAIVTFTSADAEDPTAWENVDTLKTGEKLSALFGKLSAMFKNLRFVKKLLGDTDLTGIGDGTVTGAVKTINDSQTIKEVTYAEYMAIPEEVRNSDGVFYMITDLDAFNAYNIDYNGEKNVGEALDTCNDWLALGHAIGLAEIDYTALSNTAKEFLITVEHGGSSSVNLKETFVIKNTGVMERLMGGYYYSAEYNASICVTVNGTTKKIYIMDGWSQITGGGAIANAILTVYYR